MEAILQDIAANWKLYGPIGAALAFLAWFNRAKVGGFVSTAKTAVAGERIGCDAIGVHAVHLVEIRDMLSKAGEADAVEAIDSVVLPAIFQARDAINNPAVTSKAAAPASAPTTTTSDA